MCWARYCPRLYAYNSATVAVMAGTRPTLDDVANASGVSRMTVSNVYGHPDRVAPSTREAVLEAAERLGYAGPSPAGRTLRHGRSGVVGLLIGDDLPYLFVDPGAASFMQGLATEVSALDLSLQVIHASGPSAVRKVHDAIVDAWITFGIPDGHAALTAVVERRQRIVTAPGPRLAKQPMVTIDAAAGAGTAIDHLVSLGHRQFVVVVPPISGSPTWRERLDGSYAALEGAGLDAGRLRVVHCASNSRAAGRAAAADVLRGSRAVAPVAVFAATDVIALGILDGARDLQVHVPGEASLVGFDDIEEAASSSPPLTTVRQDLRAQGARAAALAAATSAPRRLVHTFPTSLVVRSSTAPFVHRSSVRSRRSG